MSVLPSPTFFLKLRSKNLKVFEVDSTCSLMVALKQTWVSLSPHAANWLASTFPVTVIRSACSDSAIASS